MNQRTMLTPRCFERNGVVNKLDHILLALRLFSDSSPTIACPSADAEERVNENLVEIFNLNLCQKRSKIKFGF